jgi:ribosomal protein S18 acetylase RimI-like enzyme
MAAELRSILTLPAALAEQGFALRPETEADIAFLRRLYASTRAAELALTDWSDAQKLAFADSQFDHQRRHYRAHYADADWSVLDHDGVPAGRLYLHRAASVFEVVDIALLPQWCGRGIGTALMQAVCALARAGGGTVIIYVEKFNPALRLYRRLGFREAGDEGSHWRMQWVAADDDARDQLKIA